MKVFDRPPLGCFFLSVGRGVYGICIAEYSALLTKCSGSVLNLYKSIATLTCGARTVNLSKWSSGSDFVGKLWPNGEFGLGFQKRSQMTHKVKEEVSVFENPTKPEMLAYACRQAIRQRWCDETGNSLPSLGLSPHVKSHKRQKRGLKGISSYGRKMVRSGAYLLQKRYGRNRLSFLTLTLPSVSVEQSYEISRNWSEIVRKFLQSLGRLLRRRSMPATVVGCTEIQESRLESSGVLGLHLHLVFVGRSARSGWVVSYKEARKLWKRELDRVLGEDLNCDSTENMERVKKDAEQYLGKYMSKGLSSVQSLVNQGLGDVLPSSWWCMTMELRRWIALSMRRLEGEGASLFVRLVEIDAEVFLYHKPVEITMGDGEKLKVGYFGKLKREFIQSLYA